MGFTDNVGKGYCEIRIKGKLEARWADWFDLMTVASDADSTVISGSIADQAALQGLMEKMSMLGMIIVSIDFRA